MRIIGIVDRVSVECRHSTETRWTIGRHLADTLPILDRHLGRDIDHFSVDTWARYQRIVRKMDDFRHLLVEYRPTLLASARPILGRVSVECRHSTDTRSTIGRHLADTLPTLGRHSANTLPTFCRYSNDTRLILDRHLGRDKRYRPVHFLMQHATRDQQLKTY